MHENFQRKYIKFRIDSYSVGKCFTTNTVREKLYGNSVDKNLLYGTMIL